MDAIGKLAWPITVLSLVFLFRRTIATALTQLVSRGGEIAVAGLSIKFPVMQQAALGDDVLAFKASDSMTVAANSGKSTLLRMLRGPGLHEYVIISIGDGREWISSRLYIFVLMLQRMKGVRCIVFLEGSVPKFLGTASPERVRWALAQEQPWLEKAYLLSMQQAVQYQPESFIVSNDGALDPQIADLVVRAFVLQQVAAAVGAAMPPEGKEWAKWGDRIEFGSTWLSGLDLQRALGSDLHRDALVEAADHRSEARALLQCPAPYVARVKGSGEFLSLIDRTAFVNELTARLLTRLDSMAGAAPKT